MFFRVKNAGSYQYLQIVHSVRQGEKVRQQIFGNLNACFLLSKLAARSMVQQGRGKIINIASELALFGSALNPAPLSKSLVG